MKDIANSKDNFSTEANDNFENSLLDSLYNTIQTNFLNYNFPTLAQRTAHIQDLYSNPQKSLYWHLCLMEESSTQNTSKKDGKTVGEWLAIGLENGWLRKVNLDNNFSPLHKLYLNQEEFWQRLIFACEHRKGRLSLVLFKLDPKHNRSHLRELIEQILIVSKKQDFFGEITGFGLALALPETGSFGACACAERILTCVNSAMPDLQLSVGLTEALEGENADTVFAHAKEALMQNKQNEITAKVYQHNQQEKQNCSLVRADEKRFLFFGM